MQHVARRNRGQTEHLTRVLWAAGAASLVVRNASLSSNVLPSPSAFWSCCEHRLVCLTTYEYGQRYYYSMMATDCSVDVEREIVSLRSHILRSQRENGSLQVNSENRDTSLPYQFELAVLLSCTSQTNNLIESVSLLKQLVTIGYRKPECLYQLCLIYIKTGNYEEACKASETLLTLDPRNVHNVALRSFVTDRMAYDGLSGMLVFASLLGFCALITNRCWTSLSSLLHKLGSGFYR